MRSRFGTRLTALAVLCSAVSAWAAQTLPAVPKVEGPLGVVNIMQGTKSDFGFSHGNTLPLVSAPWAMTDWSIQNKGNINESWFYHSDSTTFVGFRATHQPSPWMGDYGQFMITPQTGEAKVRSEDRQVPYDPAATILRPDYMRVRLESYRITAELTATERCAVIRMQFDPADKVGRLVFDIAGDGKLLADGKQVVGQVNRAGRAPKNFAHHFAAELDRPVTKVEAIGSKDKLGVGMGYIEFDISENPVVEFRIATSYISREQAARNLAVETKGGFDETQQRTAKAWSEQLAKIDVSGTDDHEATFYTCLYRALKFPHKLHELDANGKPTHYSPWDGKVHPGVAYTDSGLWDTFRTHFPFLSVAYPEQYGEIIAGWLNAFDEGGWLPQWPSPGGFRGMNGTHADAMVADAMVKEIKGFDYKKAYTAVRRDALDIPGRGDGGGREAMRDYLKLGYVPVKKAGGWVSMSLDYAYDDWCVAQAAKLVGKDDDYKVLMERAQNYRKLWDPEVKFMRGKDAEGNWEPNFDEFHWGDGYTEGGPWQTSWGVQHDALGMAELAGGKAAFGEILDKLFTTEPKFSTGGYGGVIHEMKEMVACNMGQYAGSNQPSFHIPHLYAAIGQPWKTDFWTRKALVQLFNAGPQGYVGDEDNGSNAAWFLLNSMGIYSLTPGHPTYVLTSPLFDSVTIHLANGKKFTVTAKNNSAENVYVQSRTLNGKPYTNLFIDHADLAKGGTLEVELGPKAHEREVKTEELPYSATTLSSEKK